MHTTLYLSFDVPKQKYDYTNRQNKAVVIVAQLHWIGDAFVQWIFG